ncbi:dipeptide/oligopeptide/nickel ABC transporter ATP-binding protein [Brevibacillus reuszeri]|uniref:ABC transporter ATP-binding protein n=1 Tax=Brevibacillus reuszeri TaxID=54915 RepID=UPI001B245BF0|nr:ABC transporter ATP-binding protein [Brevibacillus reuszeri]GIO08605.1 dipeptide/oligopeptide/nickel ABC transporter ATP-binding protein [Brevibacillus reuszeri]
MSRDKPKVLEVRNVKTRIKMENREYAIIEDIDFHVDSKETVGIVGESGCGKSMTALSIMGLLPENANVSEGEIRLQGANLLSISKDAYRKKRGKEMSMIFQEPMSSLNPVYTIGFQLIELLREHTIMSKSQAKKKAIEMLQTVGIPRPHEVINEYPHQLSGGMRQRVMIAMGLACNPDILIADEPTTALDVTIQAQILELMKKLQVQFDMAILLITHDLGVVAEVCDRVIVMYAGQIVEEAPVLTLFETPSHPYTKGLIASTPKIGDEKDRLHTIEGTVPQLSAMPKGCRFSTRCLEVTERCLRESPPLVELSEHVRCRCWLYPNTSGVSV